MKKLDIEKTDGFKLVFGARPFTYPNISLFRTLCPYLCEEQIKNLYYGSSRYVVFAVPDPDNANIIKILEWWTGSSSEEDKENRDDELGRDDFSPPRIAVTDEIDLSKPDLYFLDDYVLFVKEAIDWQKSR